MPGRFDLVSVRRMTSRILDQATGAALLLLVLSTVLLLFVQQVPRFFLQTEAEYGDSYILYDVERFRQSGVIYRDLSGPPYVPVLYSPMVYIALSLPGRVVSRQNPFLAPRIAVVAAFVLCIAVSVSIAHVLIPVRATWFWGALLACSIGVMRPWVLQLRGDCFGIFFSLGAIRLLLERGRWAIALAGMSAGFAFQFKITLVAALATGVLYLLASRRWRDTIIFSVTGAVAAAAPYLFFWLREPRMIAQVLTIASGAIEDYSGLAGLAVQTIREPVLLLAAAALPFVVLRRSSRWLLVVGFMCTSFLVALLTGVQAGANVNYFFEGLFAATPVATWGVLKQFSESRGRWSTGKLFVCVLILTSLVLPNAFGVYRSVRAPRPWSRVRAVNDRTAALRAALEGYRILSLVPRVAILTRDPAITEPYLASYLQTLGRFDATPITEQLRRQSFEVVVTPDRVTTYRGVPLVSPDLYQAIETFYAPECVSRRLLFHVPRAQPTLRALRDKLDHIGCRPVACSTNGVCPAWVRRPEP